MTENKRFTLDFEDFCARAVFIDDNLTQKSYTIINDTIKERKLEEVVDLLNEQHETIKTLSIGFHKILKAIENDKEAQAMILCVEILKKLEEEGYLND